MVDDRYAAFFRDIVLPAYGDIAETPRIALQNLTHVIDDTIDDPLHAALIDALASRITGTLGPVLLIESRSRRTPPFGGRFVVAPMMRDAMVTPVVLYQRRGDKQLVFAAQRYAAHAEHPIAQVTRSLVRMHALASFAAYSAHA